MSLRGWKPPNARTFEDRLLAKYWREVGGLIFTEVLVGRGGPNTWPAGSKPRYIDGVRFSLPRRSRVQVGIRGFKDHADEFESAIIGATVEVIEIKYSLDRLVLGQVIVGADLLEAEYKPAKIRQVVLCKIGDPVLEKIVCKKRGIQVRIL